MFTTKDKVLPSYVRGRSSLKNNIKYSKSREHIFDNKKWYTNGEINIRSETQPEGFIPGRKYRRK